MFPKIKKEARHFMLSEDGSIDKKALFKASAIVTVSALTLFLSSESASASWRGGGGGAAPAAHSSHANSLVAQCDTKASCVGQHAHSIS